MMPPKEPEKKEPEPEKPKKEVDPTERLFIAAEGGDLEMLKKAIKDGADLEKVDIGSKHNALNLSAIRGNVACAKALLEAGAKVTRAAGKNTPLHLACRLGNLPVAKVLLEADPSQLKAKASNDWTPLHTAAYNEHAEVVRFLVNKGARVDARTKRGFNAFHLAAMVNNETCLTALIEGGINVNATTPQGATAAHIAASWGHLESLQVIAADPQRVQENTKDLGQILFGKASPKATAALTALAAGGVADFNVKDENGNTALDVAKAKKQMGVVEWFEEGMPVVAE